MAAYISQFFMVGIPAALVFACFAPYRMRAMYAQKLASGPLREAGLYLFMVCLFGLAALLLWPRYAWWNGNLIILNARESLTDGVNWEPLYMIRVYLDAIESGDWNMGKFLFGNVAVFMPLGFFPPLLFRGQRFRHILCLGLGYSLTAETLQFFLGRHCDVDDVLLNVVGTVLGYWVYLLLKRLSPALVPRFRCGKMK